ncbi:MAG: hypothetical protein DHS20C08_04700 [Rhodomicrobium sp.]|nr:MAG: hypothetical protein DHS20C08_04700 [Rhodomicrobium sp.]
MSYFTDDTPYKSSLEPLIVNNNDLPSERLGFTEHLRHLLEPRLQNVSQHKL